MSDDEALAIYIRMLKGEDVRLDTDSLSQSKIVFEQVAKWASRASSLKVWKGYHIIGRPNVPGYTTEPGSLRVTP